MKTWISSTAFRKNTQISHFMKIRPVGAELFHEDRRTDGQGWRSQQSFFAILRTRLKTKVFPCPHHEVICSGKWGTETLLLNLGNRWQCGQLHVPAALTLGKNPGTHFAGDWVGSRAGTDVTEKANFLHWTMYCISEHRLKSLITLKTKQASLRCVRTALRSTGVFFNVVLC